MADESLVLCLYSGGTIGMVQHPTTGYVPFPSFLTETLRSQSRFHDPAADSIFSWSDSTTRYKQWSDAHTRPSSGVNTPTSASAASALAVTLPSPPEAPAKTLVGVSQTLTTASEVSKYAFPSSDSSPSYSHGAAAEGSASTSAAEQSSTISQRSPFGAPVLVRSAAPDKTSVHNAVSSKLAEDGKTLELMLPTLVTPRGASGKRVRYAVLEYDPLLDSSEMDLEDWIRLAKDIALNYRHFAAFVVLHGTDTMCYTSSALSMLLENLGKTVIVTGAQVPLSELRNDAIENVLGALTLAGTYRIPEVTLYFNSTLFRGNRVSKTSNNALAAFSSPNCAPLAHVGITIDVDWSLVQRQRRGDGELRAFRAHDKMSPDVAVLRLFPGLPTATVKSFLAPPLRGVVLESYGAGNAPSRQDLLNAFKEATERGCVIVNITQCLQGEVSAIYAVGKKLQGAGVVPGGDMTPEAALAKLSYLLGKSELSTAQVRQLMSRPLRGEMTSHVPSRAPRYSLGGGGGEDGGDMRRSESDSLSSLLGSLVYPLGRSTAADVPSDLNATTATEAASSAAAAWHGSEAEVKAAERIMLPYLIHRAALSDDTASLQAHLALLARLEPLSSFPAHPIQSRTEADLSSSLGSTHTFNEPSTEDPLETLPSLHAAAARGHVRSVRLLLSAGASVHAREPLSQRSPLFLAARQCHVDVVGVLRSAGAFLASDEKEAALNADGGGKSDGWTLAGLYEKEL